MLNDGEAAPLNEYEYAGALADFLLHLPEKMVVMRLSAEAEPSEVIAPKWWMKKGQFLEMFRQVFRERSEGNADGIRAVRTEDGSYTLYHPEYRQHFHSVAGARMESWKKYIEPCRIGERLKTGDDAAILDIGFGMGYNVAALAELAERTAKAGFALFPWKWTATRSGMRSCCRIFREKMFWKRFPPGTAIKALMRRSRLRGAMHGNMF